MTENNKPQLHSSMLDMLSRCGIQFQRVYGYRFGTWHREERIPPGIALILGQAIHITAGKGFNAKLEYGDLPSVDEIKEVAADEFKIQWTAQELRLSDEEAEDVTKTYGKSLDMAVKLAAVHNQILAPKVEPLAIEEPFVIDMPNYPINLAGQMDILEKDKVGDIKTRANSTSQLLNSQTALYSLAFKINNDGKYPDEFYHDVLVKTKTPKGFRDPIKPTDKIVNPLLRRVERFIEIIEAVKAGHQAFTPADNMHWCCSKKYCGFAYDGSCPYWGGK